MFVPGKYFLPWIQAAQGQGETGETMLRLGARHGRYLKSFYLSGLLNWAENFFLHAIQVLYTHLIFPVKVEMDEIIREQLKWSLMTSSCLIIV